MFKRRLEGFTLIELLVVISIIGLLASVVLVALSGARAKSRDAKRVADLNQFAKALELFYNDAAAYPTGTAGYTGYTTGAGATLGAGVLQAITSKGTFLMTPTYLVAIPQAPTPADNASGATCTTANNAYTYQAANDGSTYTISFCLGNSTTGGLSAGIRHLTPGGFK